MESINMIQCLDKGFVRLVDHMGDDLSIIRAARVSYNEEWKTGEDLEKDTKLLKYLWKNHHTTPFESVIFTFEVKAPIFVFRQWHRHRTQSYNELSARYRELSEDFYIPDPLLIGIQSKNNKQGRDIDEALDLVVNNSLINDYIHQVHESFKLYRECLEKGWPRELARMMLPVSTYSHMFTTLNLKNLLGFLTLRDDSHAQYEIRVYAQAMKKLITPIVPITIEAYNEAR